VSRHFHTTVLGESETLEKVQGNGEWSWVLFLK